MSEVVDSDEGVRMHLIRGSSDGYDDVFMVTLKLQLVRNVLEMFQGKEPTGFVPLGRLCHTIKLLKMHELFSTQSTALPALRPQTSSASALSFVSGTAQKTKADNRAAKAAKIK